VPRVIGLDIHRDFAQAVALDGEKFTQLGRVQLDRDSLTAFGRRLLPSDEVVLEATANTFAVVRVLRSMVGKIVVANPLQVRLIADAKIKTDKIDAGVLAQLQATGFLPQVWIPDPDTEILRRKFSRGGGPSITAGTSSNSSQERGPRDPPFKLDRAMPRLGSVYGHRQEVAWNARSA
jgi:transposase